MTIGRGCVQGRVTIIRGPVHIRATFKQKLSNLVGRGLAEAKLLTFQAGTLHVQTDTPLYKATKEGQRVAKELGH